MVELDCVIDREKESVNRDMLDRGLRFLDAEDFDRWSKRGEQ